ncbi:MAG: ABC transporter permease [Spirochaetales bacterium]|nr:ABC transporter permease [Spirochaetales bacterium]
MSDINKKIGFSLKMAFANYGYLFILGFLIIISTILSPVFLTSGNIMNILRQMSITVIIAYGVTMIIISGMIDLSSGSVVALSGVIGTSAFVMTGSPWVGLIVGILVGAGTGLFNGTVITVFNLPPFIVTLAMMTVARGLALLYTGGYPIIDIDAFTTFGKGFFLGIPIPVIIMLLVFVGVVILTKRTRFGRYIFAIGGNEEAAIASGINVKRMKIMVFTLNGALVGLAGVILMSRINSGQPAAGLMYELDAITMAVIGGTSLSGGIGSITGTLVGGLIVGILKNILNLTNVSPYWQQILKGLIILIAVIMDVYTKSMQSSKK